MQRFYNFTDSLSYDPYINHITTISTGQMSISRVNDNNPLKFSMLDDESIDKLDNESLKRLFKEATIYIRAHETTLEKLTHEYTTKLKDANDKAKKANEHIEGMSNKKLKESNSQLEESHEKQARLQQELDLYRGLVNTIHNDKLKKEACVNNINNLIVNSPIQDRIGKPGGGGGEHTPQKQINGYYMYDFSQAQNGSKSLILPMDSSPSSSKLDTSYRQIFPSVNASPSSTGHVNTTYTTKNFSASNNSYSQHNSLRSEENAKINTNYTFPQQQHPNNTIITQGTPSYLQAQKISSVNATSYSQTLPREERTALDQLAEVAEMRLGIEFGID
nr:14129_t:CDS:2 [Entrophospora candida]